jgi:hypothetical protein
MSSVLGSEKMNIIDDDDGLLKVWADLEEARWGKGAVAISWGGAFSRRVAPQASGGSGGRRQHLWKMAVTQWRTIGVFHSRGKERWRYWKAMLGLAK